METTREHKWMPVFTIIESTKTRYATHPDQQSSMGYKEDIDTENYELRVGTALIQNDGSYKIQLVAFPVDGKLLMRPPHGDEHQDLTQREKSS